MATIASIRADLIGSSAVFRSEMIRGAQQANTSLGQIQRESMRTADGIIAMNKAAAGFIGFAAVRASVSSLLEAQVQMQSIQFTLLAATGSAQLAGKAFEFVQDRAHVLGLDLQPAAEGFAKLSASASALGVSMHDQMELFDAYAKSSTALHLSTEQSNRALLAMEQMFAKGKIQAQELRLQLGQAIPGAAARFQNAVMEMTKGTDLAGKSFDQLLADGELTTTRFLPALVEAMRGSGRGWEEASHGLNAELNRLRTNWFQLKSDVSGGLFDDVATGSIRIMADNLRNLAGAVGVAGGVVISRFAGAGLAAGAGAAGRYMEQQKGAMMAADAERAYARTLAATAREESAAAVSNARLQAQRISAAKDELAQRQAAAFAAQTQRDAAMATLEHQKSAAVLAANIRAQEIAEQNLAKANAVLANEQRMAAGATVRYQEAVRLAAAADAELVAANNAVALSAERVAAANAMAAESNAAAGLAANLGRAAKSLGSFALGLVGGPWGAAVLAVGAVGYSLLSLQKQSEQYRQETTEQVKSLQQLREQVQAATKDYGNLNAAMGLAQTIDVYRQASDELQKKRDEIADLQDKILKVRSTIDGTGNGMIMTWLGNRKIAELTDRIKELQDQLPATTQNVDALGAKLAGSMAPAIDAVKGAIDRLRNGGSLRDVLAGFGTDIDAGIKNVDAARKAVQDIQTKMQSDAKSMAEAVATANMNNAEKQQYALRQGLAQINAQRLTPEAKGKQIDELTASAAVAIQKAAAKDAADAAKKNAQEAIAAARQQQQAYESLTNSQNGQLESLRQQIDGGDKLTAAQRELNAMLAGGDAAFRKLSVGMQADAIARQRSIVTLTDQANAMAEAKKQAEALAVVQENLARISQQYNQQRSDALAGIGHGQKFAQDAAGMRDIQRAYDGLMARAGRDLAKGTINQGTYDKETAEYKAALDQQLRDQEDFYRQRDRMQADWRSGAVAAMEDWRDAAANTSGQVADMVTNAANNMTDAFVQFALTGKLSFKDFANSVIEDLARIAYRKAIAGIFDYALGAISPMSTAAGYDRATPAQQVAYDVAGGRASGGSTSGGSLYEVAEGGRPELYQSGGRTYLLSGQDGHVTPASRGASGGGSMAAAAGAVEVQVNITNNGQPVQAQQTATRTDGNRVIVDMVLDAVAADTARGGRTAKAMQQRFGLARRGVPVGA